MAKKGAKVAKGKKGPLPTKTRKEEQVISYPKLPPIWRIAVSAYHTIWDDRRLFLGIALVYGVLELILVKGFSAGINVSAVLKSHSLGSSFSALGQLLGTNSSNNQASATWQFILIIL